MNTITNYQSLTNKQLLCIFTISLISVSVVYLILQLDKFYNTPLINYISRVSLTAVCAIIIGIIFFKEKYGIQHIIGIDFIKERKRRKKEEERKRRKKEEERKEGIKERKGVKRSGT